MALHQTHDISTSTIFRVILIVLGFWFLYVIRDVLLMLLAAIVIAAAIEPVADYLSRYKIPRSLSVVVVYGLIIALLGAVTTLLIPALAAQISQLAHSIPDLSERVGRDTLFRIIPSGELAGSLRQILIRLGDSLTQISFDVFQRTRSIFSGIISVLFVFMVAFYMVIERDALKKMFQMIIPARHMSYVNGLIDRATKSIGRWVLAQIVLAFIVGCVVSLGLWILGFPYALVLGLLAGILEIIPVIGPVIAAIPGIVVGLSLSLLYGVIALVFYIVIQQTENNILVPNIMRKATGLNPLVTIIAVLLGARLAGVVGAMLAVPLATIVNIFWSDMMDTQPSPSEPKPKR